MLCSPAGERTLATRLITSAVASICLLACLPPALSQNPAQGAPTPGIRVDFFGAEKGYAVGSNTVTMLCVVRNAGRTPVAANLFKVRCYTLTGLDYTEGELEPSIPALAPNQAASFRWRLQPTDSISPLVASVLLTRAEAAPPKAGLAAPVAPAAPPGKDAPTPESRPEIPQAVIAVVPHLPHSFPDVTDAFSAPGAAVSGTLARVGNDRVLIRVAPAAGRAPVGMVFAKAPTGWETATVLFPITQILVAEEGQSPWWRAFRWTQSDEQHDATSATLTLLGTCGDDWEVQVILASRKDSGLIEGRLRLKARRTERLYSIQLPTCISRTDHTGPAPPADGSSAIIASAYAPDEDANLAAAHYGAVTSGIAWQPHAPFQDWVAFPLPAGDTDHTMQLGCRWSGGDRGEVVLPGGIVEVGFRIFCISPSGGIKDARRFAMP